MYCAEGGGKSLPQNLNRTQVSPAGARLSTEQPRVARLNGSGGRGCHAAPVLGPTLGPTRGHQYVAAWVKFFRGVCSMYGNEEVNTPGSNFSIHCTV